MWPATDQEPVLGSYSSALESSPVLLMPPATSTFPSGSSAVAASCRATCKLPVGVHVPVLGSYSSAVETIPVLPTPPATSTSPSGRRAAEKLNRAVAIDPVDVHVRVAGW